MSEGSGDAGEKEDSSAITAGLVAQLEEGESTALVAHGNFTLDLANVLDKVGAHGLADPHWFALLFVEAGHQLVGCRRIVFSIGRKGVTATLEHAWLFRDHFERSLEPLFGDPDPDHLHQWQGRRTLALALATVIGRAAGPVELSACDGAHTRVSTFHSTTSVETEQRLEEGDAWIRLRVPPLSGSAARQIRELLEERASTTEISLLVNGRDLKPRINETSMGLVDRFDVHDEAGERLGHGGWSAQRLSLDGGTIVFVANGVIIETVASPSLPAGFVVLFDATELERDLSHFKLVEGPEKARRIELAEAHFRALERAGPTPGHPDPTAVGLKESNAMIGMGAVVLMLAFLGLLLGWGAMEFALPLAAMALIGGGFGWWMRGPVVAKRELLAEGLARVGIVEEVRPANKRLREYYSGERVELVIRVQTNFDGFEVKTHALDKPGGYRRGDRLYLRVDPSDFSKVIVDRDRRDPETLALAQGELGEESDRH